MHYVLFYEYAPDYLERRAAYRDALRVAWMIAVGKDAATPVRSAD
jgi:hypothetical protein